MIEPMIESDGRCSRFMCGHDQLGQHSAIPEARAELFFTGCVPGYDG